jgi:hypothetical protein
MPDLGFGRARTTMVFFRGALGVDGIQMEFLMHMTLANGKTAAVYSSSSHANVVGEHREVAP